MRMMTEALPRSAVCLAGTQTLSSAPSLTRLLEACAVGLPVALILGVSVVLYSFLSAGSGDKHAPDRENETRVGQIPSAR